MIIETPLTKESMREINNYFLSLAPERKWEEYEKIKFKRKEGFENVKINEYDQEFLDKLKFHCEGYKQIELGSKIFTYFSRETNFLDITEQFHRQQPFYYDSFKNWWMWRQKEYRWERIDETDLMNAIDSLTRLPNTSQNIKGMLLEAFKRVGRKKKPKEPEKTWIQFKDTIIDIKTGERFPASSEYFIFNPIPHSLGESEETPVIDNLLDSWTYKENYQNGDYVRTLKEIIAYCFLADMPIHRIFCFIGEGLNGKGTFLRLIENFIGEHNKTASEIEYLATANFESAKLFKKLICTVGEIDKGIFKKTKTIKSLSGDDLVRGEFKGKDSFDFHNYAKILIATNHLPETKDKAKGFYRRWTIVDFPNEFTENKNILDEIPEHEYNNFCLQSISILKNLLDNGRFTNDGSIKDRTEKYEKYSNDINHYIAEFYVKDNESSIEFKEFCEDYNDYLISDGKKKKSKVEIGRLITNLGFEKKAKKVTENAFQTTKLYIFGLKSKFGGLAV
jgi:P4 family phage/plasmid primase-like protien